MRRWAVWILGILLFLSVLANGALFYTTLDTALWNADLRSQGEWQVRELRVLSRMLEPMIDTNSMYELEAYAESLGLEYFRKTGYADGSLAMVVIEGVAFRFEDGQFAFIENSFGRPMRDQQWGNSIQE